MTTGAGGSCSCCVHNWDAERGERWGAASVSRVIFGPWVGVTTPRMITSAGPLWKRLYRHWGVDLQVMVVMTKITPAFVLKAVVTGLCCWPRGAAGSQDDVFQC